MCVQFLHTYLPDEWFLEEKTNFGTAAESAQCMF